MSDMTLTAFAEQYNLHPVTARRITKGVPSVGKIKHEGRGRPALLYRAQDLHAAFQAHQTRKRRIAHLTPEERALVDAVAGWSAADQQRAKAVLDLINAGTPLAEAAAAL